MQGLRRSSLIPILFVAAAALVFVSLGIWQVQRLHWKEGLIADIQARQQQPALGTLPGSEEEWKVAEYRNAVLTGEFLGDISLRYVGHQAGGYVLYTPFKLEDSDQVILVIRGFLSGIDLAPPKGITTVQGFLRAPRAKRLFAPENHPEKNMWFIEDMPAMAQALHRPLPPLLLDTADRAPLRNDHLGYAIMWFALAAVALGMGFAYCRKSTKSTPNGTSALD